jgi:hypothetical protein
MLEVAVQGQDGSEADLSHTYIHRALLATCFMLISCFAYSSVDFQWATSRNVPEVKILHNFKTYNFMRSYIVFNKENGCKLRKLLICSFPFISLSWEITAEINARFAQYNQIHTSARCCGMGSESLHSTSERTQLRYKLSMRIRLCSYICVK